MEDARRDACDRLNIEVGRLQYDVSRLQAGYAQIIDRLEGSLAVVPEYADELQAYRDGLACALRDALETVREVTKRVGA